MPETKNDTGGLRLVRNIKNTSKTPAAPTLSRVRVQNTIGRGSGKPSLFEFTLIVIYKNLYILGCTLLRRKRKYLRKARLGFSKIRGSFLAGTYKLGRSLIKLWLDFIKRMKAPFLRIGNVYREQKPLISSKRSQGRIPVASYAQIAEAVARLIARMAETVLNYSLPVITALIAVLFVNGLLSQSFGLEVIYEGKQIGYIKSEADFDNAVLDVKSRTIYGGSTYTTSVPSFELVVCVDPDADNAMLTFYNSLLQKVGLKLVEAPQYTSVTELADSIIRASGNEVEEAYGFYMDGRLYGAVRNKNIILDTLDGLKDRAASGRADEELKFDKSIALDDGLYPTTSIIDESVIVDILTSYETVDQIYIVQPNDTPLGIAGSQGIPYDFLKEINPGIEEQLIPGQEIKTAAARPFLSVKSTFTEVYTEDVEYETIEIENAIYARGYRQVTQKGENGTRRVTAAVTTVNGMEVERVVLNSVELTVPVPEKVTVGANVQRPAAQAASGSASQSVPANLTVSETGFMWPVSSGYVSNYLGGYRGHSGIDIAGDMGSPIYASASGTVTLAKRLYYGYGIHIKINHGNGFETLYAHCSNIYVSVGDYVQQGQIIGARGSTGNSSGPHLHFEVIYNKSIQNPMNYVSPY